MDLQEYTSKLRGMVENVSKDITERILVLSANELLATIKNRIMREGKDSADRKMKPYSTKPMYASRGEFVRKSSFRPVGKNGFKGERLRRSENYISVTLKNGKTKQVREKVYNVVKSTPKTMFLEQGYKELRDIQGMDTNVKNLTYSGDFMNSYVLGVSDNQILLGLNNEEASKIRKGQERKNGGKILHASKKEMAEYRANVVKQYREAFLNSING